MDVSPLFGLRLRTPRLQLRLPTGPELEDLREVALGGIHPPDFMPFTIAWTDDPELGNFVEYHETQRREWSPDAWHLELGVWLEGELAGVQAFESTGFAETRTVGTGSWLGSSFQGRGVGTEMRLRCSSSLSGVWERSRPGPAPSTGTRLHWPFPRSSATGSSTAERSRHAVWRSATRTSS